MFLFLITVYFSSMYIMHVVITWLLFLGCNALSVVKVVVTM